MASASIPGLLPPVLIHVSDSRNSYDEMHVDGGTTAPFFFTWQVAPMLSLPAAAAADLQGANLYIIINGQLGTTPQTTREKTIPILKRSFSTELMHAMRTTLELSVEFARLHGMNLRFSRIPPTIHTGDRSTFNRRPSRPCLITRPGARQTGISGRLLNRYCSVSSSRGARRPARGNRLLSGHAKCVRERTARIPGRRFDPFQAEYLNMNSQNSRKVIVACGMAAVVVAGIFALRTRHDTLVAHAPPPIPTRFTEIPASPATPAADARIPDAPATDAQTPGAPGAVMQTPDVPAAPPPR
ncbi:MAG: hypothetical protein PVS2B3_03170 [Steroidobacteraceae bacterium]